MKIVYSLDEAREFFLRNSKDSCYLKSNDSEMRADCYPDAVEFFKPKVISTAYDGTFDLEFLRQGESIRAGGDGTVVIESDGKQLRMAVGDVLIRRDDGSLEVEND